MTTAARLTATVPSFHGYSGATLHLDIDPTEHARRQNTTLRYLKSPGLLDTLLTLPVGEPIPLANLTPQQRASLRRAPAGAVHICDGMVTRLAIRPCRIRLATVRFPTASRTALESAGRFAPMAARAVIVERRPAMTETLLEYDFWGVGISLDTNGELETLVEPRPWVPKRHTPAGWRFTELAYAAYLTHKEDTP